MTATAGGALDDAIATKAAPLKSAPKKNFLDLWLEKKAALENEAKMQARQFVQQKQAKPVVKPLTKEPPAKGSVASAESAATMSTVKSVAAAAKVTSKDSGTKKASAKNAAEAASTTAIATSQAAPVEPAAPTIEELTENG